MAGLTPARVSAGARVVTAFDAGRHAPGFANRFPRGTPVLSLPTPFGRVALGDAADGLCGGMVFAALDAYLWGVPPPGEPTPAVVRYLSRRLLASWDIPAGLLKYYAWQRRDQATLHRLTTEVEWPAIRARLDAGTPVPLGVVKPLSRDPRRLVRNHQVLARGYELTGAGVRIWVYDPNYPEADASLELAADPERALRHSCEGETVRGVFRSRYARPAAPPDWRGG